nr:hypothetical protein [Tanacetum cinerariifolium]
KPDVLRIQPKPSIPYPSRLNDQKLREKATNQMEKFFQIFHDLHFDIRFAEALLLMPKFASTIKSLLANKDKRFELAKVLLNENCSAMLLKKLSEKLGDPELTPTRMTPELADRSITHPKGVAEDVFVKLGKFHFATDFIVVDFEADPRVPLILGRICARCLDFQYNPKSSNPTLVSDDSISENNSCKVPIVKSSSLTLTPFGESDFILEEIKDFLNDDSILNEIDDSDFDPKGDIRLIEKLLNVDPCSLPPMDLKLAEESKEKSSVEEPPELELKDLPSHLDDFILEEIEDFLNDDSIPNEIDDSNFDPKGDIRLIEKLLNVDPCSLPPMDLKLSEESKEKSFVEEPPELELKDLPSHLEYVFLEDSNKLPVIIAKNLKVDEREALLNVLKSHKRAVAWKISDIKGIDPSPWVSPIHCVPKKGGITVVANKDNELIPTRLVNGWRVCIDYRKLNDATRKDHFPLLFMDQML